MVEFRVLGPLEVLVDGRPVTLGGVKPRSVLAVLLLHANTVVSTDRLIDEVWGEHAVASRQTLHGYVSNLRQSLTSAALQGSGVLVSQKPGYVARVGEDQLDLLRFEAGCSDGARFLAAGDHAAAARRLREALGLWRGPA